MKSPIEYFRDNLLTKTCIENMVNQTNLYAVQFKCCENLMSMAKEARKHKLGPLHPSFKLLRIVRDTLVKDLPEDAHLKASGRLCVSLTRVSDGKNVIVSEFDNKEELVQALICSCFFPVYCGINPPSFRGVRYMDGALSNNMPYADLNKTITMSPFAGESDVCPREGPLNFHILHHNNVSIQFNTYNAHRVTTAFFPPKVEILAKVCQSGYVDALRFLRENKTDRLKAC
ncbi:patatin-like phospholipase domain-containing protein 2 [Aplochiton taeniatus]